MILRQSHHCRTSTRATVLRELAPTEYQLAMRGRWMKPLPEGVHRLARGTSGGFQLASEKPIGCPKILLLCCIMPPNKRFCHFRRTFPDRSYPGVFGREGFPNSLRAMCPEVNSNVKREMREYFGLQSKLIIALTALPRGCFQLQSISPSLVPG